MGAINTDIAELLAVHINRFYAWKIANSDFSEAIKRGKSKVDREVAASHRPRLGMHDHPATEMKFKSVEYENCKKVSEEESVQIVTLEEKVSLGERKALASGLAIWNAAARDVHPATLAQILAKITRAPQRQEAEHAG